MKKIAIVAGGPEEFIPNLKEYQHKVDIWIAADKGIECLIDQQLPIHLAIGDFDSATHKSIEKLQDCADRIEIFPVEKDETDLELAIDHAIQLKPAIIYLFGATGGRIDHELGNIQLLYKIQETNVKAIIIDKQNQLALYRPGTYQIERDEKDMSISFLPFGGEVEGLTLTGFYYPLQNGRISLGSTRCLSNHLISKIGTFSFRTGILIVVKSRDVLNL